MAHKVYLTYSEYEVNGGKLPGPEFTMLELKARKRIDRLTASRVQDMAEVPCAVKLCMMSLIGMDKVVGTEAQADKPVVSSFTTDGYSESYGKAMDASAAHKAMDSLIGEYLYGEIDDKGVPLLYRGVSAYDAAL